MASVAYQDTEFNGLDANRESGFAHRLRLSRPITAIRPSTTGEDLVFVVVEGMYTTWHTGCDTELTMRHYCQPGRPRARVPAGLISALALSVVVQTSARGEEPHEPPDSRRAAAGQPQRTKDQPLSQILAGPFRSTRLFTMPVADVLGPYQLSASGDSSLMAETGVLSTTSVVAVGVGDIGQLEYRSEAATTTADPVSVQLPSLGVQFKAPLPERRYWPSVAIALRLGLAAEDRYQTEEGELVFDEKVTDAYLVGRLRLWGPVDWLTLHGGLRVGQASLHSRDERIADVDRYVFLPAGGWEARVTDRTRIVGELAAVPAFEPGGPARPSRVTSKPFGRLGVRWWVHEAVVLDASMGYRIETTKIDSGAAGLNAFVDWDIRLGGEIFVPWGALICRAGGIFCE